jgi:hypothetical protein
MGAKYLRKRPCYSYTPILANAGFVRSQSTPGIGRAAVARPSRPVPSVGEGTAKAILAFEEARAAEKVAGSEDRT